MGWFGTDTSDTSDIGWRDSFFGWSLASVVSSISLFPPSLVCMSKVFVKLGADINHLVEGQVRIVDRQSAGVGVGGGVDGVGVGSVFGIHRVKSKSKSNKIFIYGV